MNHGIWRCSYPGCGKVVKGIYCPTHKGLREVEMQAAIDAAREARSAALKAAWAADPEGMKRKQAEGRARAQRGDPA
jgi:hypothetical protein